MVKHLKCLILSQRVNIAIMGFFAIAAAYTMRACLNVAITTMVLPGNHTGGDDKIICPKEESSGSAKNSTGPQYKWSESQQGYVLASFYVGYVITHVPGGIIAEKYGGKWTLSLGIFSTAIFTLMTPLVVEHFDYIGLIVLRILMGLGEGTTFPALSVLLAAWVPAKERSKLGSFVFGGGQIGSVLSYYISALILTHWSWKIVFYFWGALSCVWFLVFTLLCYSDPESHPFISKKERDYLQTEIGRLKRQDSLPPTPWKEIFTSVPIFALISAQIGHDWGFYVMVTDLPKYMKDVLGFSVHNVGLYASLPYLLMWAVSVSSGVLADYLIHNDMVTVTQARKLFTAIAAFFPAFFIVSASYAECSKVWVVIWFTLAMGFMGTYYPGMKVNSLDLSPNYAGSLMAVTNGIGALTGVITPIFIAELTPNRLLDEWRVAFWITFVILIVTTVIYSIWASGEIQMWNYPKEWKSTEDVSTDAAEVEPKKVEMINVDS